MSERSAFLFAGQGAQRIGMGKAFWSSHPPARRMFDQASKVLALDLAKLCFEGPEDALQRTDVCQPALLVTGLAAADWLESAKRPPVAAAAGLSLGEYTALVYANAIRFEDGVRLVMWRGKWMQEACDSCPGGMVSVIGAPLPAVEQAVFQAALLGKISISNINSPSQTVISGEKRAIEEAESILKKAGYRTIPLRVAGAYHSPLMFSAQEKMAKLLAKVEIRPPKVPIVSNIDGIPKTDPDEIRSALVCQVTGTVRWLDSILRLRAMGCRRFYELGPGKILTGLLSKIDPNLVCTPIEEPSDNV